MPSLTPLLSSPVRSASVHRGIPHYRFLVSLVGLVVGLLSAARGAWGHHGGDVRLREQAGPFLITLFTEPTPVLAGPVDLSVMVQDSIGERLILDAEVTLRFQEHGSSRPPLMTQATRQHSTNKLLYSAVADLPTSGLWELQVSVQYGVASVQVDCEIIVAPPGAWRLSFWPYAFLLPVALGLMILHQWLSKGRDLGARVPGRERLL